jgi:hypothetical protein
MSLVHGASSERAIEAVAAEVHETIRDVAPWLDEPQFAPAVHRYLRAASREQLLDQFIAQTVEAKGAGKVPSRTWEQATAATRLANSLASDLGLTPTGHARLRAIAGGAAAAELTLGDLVRKGQQAMADRGDGSAGSPALSTSEPSERSGEAQ